MSAALAQWAAASVALHTLRAAGAWLARRWVRNMPGIRRRGAVWDALAWMARSAYFIGVPYAALAGGLVTPAQFALGAPDAAQALRLLPTTAGVFAAGAAAILLHARLAVPRYPPGVRPAVRRRAQLAQPWGVSFLLLDALCLQTHWTFYRAAAVLVAPALGVWGGAATVTGEWLLDIGWIAGWGVHGIWEEQAMLLALMLLSAQLAALGGSFWLTLCAHCLLWVGWLALMRLLYRT